MKNVILLSVGSFNPITFMHLRCFTLAKDYLFNNLQWNVLGGIISPVHDGYKKKDLASAEHRIRMVELALEECRIPWLQVSKWEVDQPTWTKTLHTLEHHQAAIKNGLREDEEDGQVMMLCGSDVVESFSIPGLWDVKHLEVIIRNFGVVCITREGSAIEEIIRNSAFLSQFKEEMVIVPEWFPNTVSSSLIRNAIEKRLSIGMLVAVSVENYIKEKKLYLGQERVTSGREKPLVFVFKAIKSGGVVDPYEQALSSAGWRVALIPVVNFQFLGIPELTAAIFQPDKYSGIVLTSPRAVEAVAMTVQADSKGWEEVHRVAWNSKAIYAVGDGTASLAKSLGLTTFGQEAGNEAALAEIIKEHKGQHVQKPLLFPCGNLRLETLRLALEEMGIPMECILVYETSPHPQLVTIVRNALETQGYPDVNVFFSPSGIQFMDELLRAESLAFKQTQYVAIGPTTGGALRKAGYPVSATACNPKPESLVNAIQATL